MSDKTLTYALKILQKNGGKVDETVCKALTPKSGGGFVCDHCPINKFKEQFTRYGKRHYFWVDEEECDRFIQPLIPTIINIVRKRKLAKLLS